VGTAARRQHPRKPTPKYAERQRERFLSAAELRRLCEVLNEMEAEQVELPCAIAAVRLLVLTGCRLKDRQIAWEHVDLA
jgi:integrase